MSRLQCFVGVVEGRSNPHSSAEGLCAGIADNVKAFIRLFFRLMLFSQFVFCAGTDTGRSSCTRKAAPATAVITCAEAFNNHGWHHHVSAVLCCYAFVAAERSRSFSPSAERTMESCSKSVAA